MVRLLFIVASLLCAHSVGDTASHGGAGSDSLVLADRVDLIEVNHFYDEHGKLVFDQIIFYDWCDRTCRFQVRAWRMFKRPAQFPSLVNGEWKSQWHEGGDSGRIREVRARAFRESWTQYDRELIERDFLPQEHRRQLYTPAYAGKSIPWPPSWGVIVP